MELTTAEMYSGIGGMRYGLEKSGWRTVWANDNNKYACQIYRKNFGDKEIVEGDIRTIDPNSIPDHNLLTGGFPCQSFSLAGKRKGFQDIRGTLFHEIVRVAGIKRPKLLLLENVKGLLSNDNGKTFGTILESLGNIGYWVEWKTLNSKHFGVPQNRERVFIVGHLRTEPSKQIFPIRQVGEGVDEPCGEAQGEGSRVRTVNSLNCSGSGKERNLIERKVRIHRDDEKKSEIQGYSFFPETAEYVDVVDNHPKNILVTNTVSHRYGKDGSENLIQTGNLYENKADAGRVYDSDGLARSLKGQAGGLGGKTGLYQVQPLAYLGRNQKNYDNQNMLCLDGRQSTGLREGQRIRRLTPTECERLQSFPDGWTQKGLTKEGKELDISDSQRYKVLGNAVTTNVIEFLGKHLSSLF